MWGFAALWAALAAGLTVRAARQRLPFSLSWWSFTFPVGTCVTAASGLALHTGADAFRWAAVALYIALVGAWAVVGVRTARGAWRGRLFLPPPQIPTLSGSPPRRSVHLLTGTPRWAGQPLFGMLRTKPGVRLMTWFAWRCTPGCRSDCLARRP